MNQSGETALSFTISSLKKNPVKRLNHNAVDVKEEKEFILGSEGKELVSSNPKKEKKHLVIPMIKSKDWRTNKKDGDSIEEIEAAKELIKELESGNVDNQSKDTVTLSNSVVKNADMADRKMDEKPEANESTIRDYENIPVASFGAALLRGMGWSEGKPLGLSSKGLAAPIEFIPRHKGLGLGAEKRQAANVKQRKRKLGEDLTKDKYATIIDDDGRVRHIKKVGEEVKEKVVGFFQGSFVIIQKGAHKGLYGKIISADEDNARISVELKLSGQMIEISQFSTDLVDKQTYELNSKKEINKTSEHSKENDTLDSDIQIDFENPESLWVMPNIRVRIISKTYKNGKYYNEKVKLLDVLDNDICSCMTNSKKLLEDVRQNYLETIIPKKKGDYVLIVDGKYKGKLGKIMERHKSKSKATIQLTSNKHTTTLSYDEISEYVGELPDDEFL